MNHESSPFFPDVSPSRMRLITKSPIESLQNSPLALIKFVSHPGHPHNAATHFGYIIMYIFMFMCRYVYLYMVVYLDLFIKICMYTGMHVLRASWCSSIFSSSPLLGEDCNVCTNILQRFEITR